MLIVSAGVKSAPLITSVESATPSGEDPTLDPSLDPPVEDPQQINLPLSLEVRTLNLELQKQGTRQGSWAYDYATSDDQDKYLTINLRVRALSVLFLYPQIYLFTDFR